MKESIKMDNEVVMVNMCLGKLKERCEMCVIWGIMKIIRKMVKEYFCILMVWSMKVVGKMIYGMVLVCIFIWMVICIEVNGSMIEDMDKGFIYM